MLKTYQNAVILTDFANDIATAQIALRFENVLRFITSLRQSGADLPFDFHYSHTFSAPSDPTAIRVTQLSDVPFGHIDAAAYSLYTLYRMFGKTGRPNLFIHVTDPHFSAERSLLITDEGNAFIGPNNGSLGLIQTYFSEKGIPATLYTLNQDVLEQFERTRKNVEDYRLPQTFHGRDLFALAAALLAAGVAPESFAAAQGTPNGSTQGLVFTPFGHTLAALPQNIGERITCHAFRDHAFGNLKTNLSVSSSVFEKLIQEGAVFKVGVAECAGLFDRLFNRPLIVSAAHVFGDKKQNEPILYLGSSFSPKWNEQFAELAVNMGNAGDVLGLSHTEAAALFVERVR